MHGGRGVAGEGGVAPASPAGEAGSGGDGGADGGGCASPAGCGYNWSPVGAARGVGGRAAPIPIEPCWSDGRRAASWSGASLPRRLLHGWSATVDLVAEAEALIVPAPHRRHW